MRRPVALALIVATLLLIVIGLALPAGQGGHMASAGSDRTDAVLYARIVDRVRAGEPYHAAAVAEQRARNYPVRPFVTVRPPTLAWLTAAIGTPATGALLVALMAAAATSFALTLRASATTPSEWITGAALGAWGAALVGQPALAMWHDIWAGLLLMLAIGLWRPGGPLPAIVAALAAVAIRELALPFLLVMGAGALVERRWREVLGWSAATIVAMIAIGLHAHAVLSHTLPGDPVSQGWTGGGGWPLLLTMLRQTSLFGLFPPPVVAVFVPLALLGWLARGDALGWRVSLLLIGYGTMLMLFARPDNFYWSVLIAPVLPAGLAFLPRLVTRLRVGH